ncbi:hypothetical protein AALP_AA4G226700 [Arabis alpina]|uniref:Jacalin-type lectin domain-containing protein n=1 Tax=Arabis alpina TaxID=50452 RepID=A0A087H4Z6_ARAAL|nr:hypothetical protein AALP_AA4G226700 [Arabis alpina]
MEMIRAGSVGTVDKSVELYGWEMDDDCDVCDTEWDEKGRTRISHIYVCFDQIIRSIQFGDLENGALVLSKKYGTSEGYSFQVVKLNQDEYVTGLSGSVAGCYGPIRNLTFRTNRRTHGPIGHDDNGASPRIEIDPAISDRREFGGFFGSNSRACLSSIGIYVNPIATSDTAVKRETM